MNASKNFDDLVVLMKTLRAECPWDKKQTNRSLIPYAIEETYELVEAIQTQDIIDIKGELGDVLLQVVFHACLYAEQQAFDMGDVIFTLMEKLIRRHPHVFEKETLQHNGLLDENAVAKRWQQIKAQEKLAEEKRGKKASRLDAVKAGSGLTQAQAIQKQASKLGFDWADVVGAKEKLYEEVAELETAIETNNKADMQNELGDCLFALVNVARKLNIDSETAIQNTIHKFRTRFAFIEDALAEQGKTPETASLVEMDALWEQAKTDSTV